MMNGKVKRICVERDNGLVTYDRMKSAVRRLKNGGFSDRIFAAVSLYLRSRNYVLDYRELFSVLEKLSGTEDLTYRELCAVPDHIVFCIYSDILSIDDKQRENALNTLRIVDILNTEKLFKAASNAEKYMLTLSPERFSGCDKNTKNSVRERISDLAEKRKTDEYTAARNISLTVSQDQPASLKAMYFVFMLLLTVIAYIGVLFFFDVGPVVSVLLILPISQTAKDLSDRAFAGLCKTDSLPKLDLDKIPDE